MMNLLKSKAFTLAEVLLTLTIIGVVAAMSVPALMANTQKQEYITALKKAYSIWNSALAKMAVDYGCPGDIKCTDIFKDDYDGTSGSISTTDQQIMGDIVAKFFNISKNCGLNAGCFSQNVSDKYDGSGARTSVLYNDTTARYRFTTADGMHFAIHSAPCVSGFSRGITNHMQQRCGNVYIDVNGDKGPNNLGRDIFAFFVTNGKGPLLYPLGGSDNNNEPSWNDNNSDGTTGDIGTCYPGNKEGQFCAGRVIEEGWQMDY